MDAASRKGTLNEYGNRFLESSGDLLVLDVKVLCEFALNKVAQMEGLDSQQYKTFMRVRLDTRSNGLNDTIKKKKIFFFKQISNHALCCLPSF